MARGGAARQTDEPERRCIATGESQPKAGLIRFAISPEGVVVADVLGKLPGRGLWVSADRAALEKAIAKGLFARAAKATVTVPPTLLADTEAALVRYLTGLISLERKAGRAVTGFEKVKDWLTKGTAAVLIQASDGSERGKSKLWPPEGEGGLIVCLTAEEIGLSFGRDYAIHAALAAGGLTPRVVEEAARLSGLRGMGGVKRTPRKDKKI
jgi:predicted RNA-binding protein YlxR (DUF448 family)